MRGLVSIAVALLGCGRINFGTSTSGGGGDDDVTHDSEVLLSCSNYTSLDACRREVGCTPIVCDDCPCDEPTMVGCIGRGDSQVGTCPTPTCTGCCVSGADCMGFMEYCLAPDQSSTCGVCRIDDFPCGTDLDCPDATCNALPCGCGSKTCEQSPCTNDLDCTPGQLCGGSGHCVVRSCSVPEECPVDFTCAGGGCVRRSCTTDAECSAHCVGGKCYSGRGTCTTQPI